MTIGEWRRELRERFRLVSGEPAAYEADRLIGEVVGAGPTELTLRHREPVSDGAARRLENLVADRLRGRPLAYVVGHVEFCGLDLLCDERALIPRPETEELVDIALQCLPPPRTNAHPLAIDVGTGSGNIALALAHRRPDLRVIATDISAEALALAPANRVRTGLSERVHFVLGYSLAGFRGAGTADLVVSNPPYIVPGDPYLDRSVADHEPATALFAGPTGIEIVAELVGQSPPILRPGGALVCEIGYDQGAAVRLLVGRDPLWGPPVLHRDLAGIERVVAVRRLT
jgi:release factor glutamine methyltransferase